MTAPAAPADPAARAVTRRRLRPGLMLRMAARDLWHERLLSLCDLLALTAVLAPLMILFGVKFGVVDAFAQRLIQNPDTRSIVPQGSGSYSATFLEELAAREDVAFVVPRTRSISAALVSVRPVERGGGSLRSLAMQATGPGDPLIPPNLPQPSAPTEILLSHAAAERLEVQAGDEVRARVTRSRAGQNEDERMVLRVIGVVPPRFYGPEAAFVTPDLLEATEDYRDDVRVPLFDWPGTREPLEGPRIYPQFRLYARSIYDVAAVAAVLENDGILVDTAVAQIAQMQALDENLSSGFWLIAGLSVAGFAVSLVAREVASVGRKRQEIAVLRLLGVDAANVVLFPLSRGLVTGLVGAASGCGLAALGAAILNSVFADSLSEGEALCRLLAQHYATAILLTVVLTVGAGAWAGRQAARIQPAEGLRVV